MVDFDKYAICKSEGDGESYFVGVEISRFRFRSYPVYSPSIKRAMRLSRVQAFSLLSALVALGCSDVLAVVPIPLEDN